MKAFIAATVLLFVGVCYADESQWVETRRYVGEMEMVVEYHKVEKMSVFPFGGKTEERTKPNPLPLTSWKEQEYLCFDRHGNPVDIIVKEKK